MAVRIVVNRLDEAASVVAKIAVVNRPAYLDALGALVVSQTQRRIRSEKTAPDGTPWKSNRQGTSILFAEGALDDSMHHEVGGNDVEVGSNMIYAGIHQDGGVIRPKNKQALSFSAGGEFFTVKSVTIPRRQYIGLSADNETEIVSFTEDFLSITIGAQ